MGWLPGNPHWNRNPLELCKQAVDQGMSPEDFAVQELKAGRLRFASEDPDAPENFPRALFLWRNNLLGSSSKGHEYFLKHLLGTKTQGVMNGDNDVEGLAKPQEVEWRDSPVGKLDLLVTLDFRMSTSCLHSDIVLPTATWYEKNDLNTSDMHPFIHPLTAAVDPVWESRSDWEIFKAIAHKFSELCPGHLGVEKDLVSLPLQHDTAMELSQAVSVKDWKKGECDLIPGKTAPKLLVVERDYPNTYDRMVTIGPLLEKLGNGGKGMSWETAQEVEHLGHFNGTHTTGSTQGRPKLLTDVDVAEAILQLAPETNGHVAVKAWQSLEKITGLRLDYADARKDEQIHFKDIVQQPRKIISSPIWSGLESHEVCYTANYTNLHGRIPWRTLTGRQQFYQDHMWMQAFGEQFAQYKPPVDMKSLRQKFPSNGEKEIVLNFLTAHQKWGIHSSYTDNLIMLTLFRGGPVVWLSEKDAQVAGLVDNDWVEVFNGNGALSARAVVSQRIPEGAVFVYHAQEKTINTPLSQSSNTRGLHNSISRIVLKPTHMIGGYAHQAYGFNYIGTIGTNRDEFVVVRKLSRVDWE
jgi:nitrate reductase / nitrite oxidoreductase, alpha subunit